MASVSSFKRKWKLLSRIVWNKTKENLRGNGNYKLLQRCKPIPQVLLSTKECRKPQVSISANWKLLISLRVSTFHGKTPKKLSKQILIFSLNLNNLRGLMRLLIHQVWKFLNYRTDGNNFVTVGHVTSRLMPKVVMG